MTHLTAPQQTEAKARAYRRADFLRLQFPAGELAFTTHDSDKTIDAVTYTAGVMLGFSGVRAAPDRKAQRISISMMAADASIRSAIEGDIHFSRMTYSIAVLDDNNVVIDGLIPIISALVSAPRLSITENSVTLDLNCESETVRFLRPRRVIAADADQQWRFTGDLGLELVPRVSRSEAEWGGKVQRPIPSFPGFGGFGFGGFFDGPFRIQ